MNDPKKVFQFALSALLTTSLLAACSPQASTPNTSSSPATGNSVSVGSNTNTSTGNNSSTQAASAADLESAMQAVIADETTVKDSQTATEDSFSTQALIEGRAEGGGEVGITQIGAEARATAQVRRDLAALRKDVKKLQAATRTRLQAQAKARADMAKAKKATLEASGAVTVNADGTVTIKPAELKAFVKQSLMDRKVRFEANKEKAKAKLTQLRAVAQAKIQKLRRKNYVARTSDVETITNADGSVTTIAKVEFKNERTGVMRTVVRSETKLNGKLVSAEYELMTTGPNGYERHVNRSVEVMDDGTRKVTIEAMTKWANGNTRERSEERVVSTDGSATGSGVVTVNKNGQSKTYEYTLGVTASGDVTVNGDDAVGTADESAETVEVTIDNAAASSETTVVVEENGEETESMVDLSEDADTASAEASAEASADASAS